jgi:hypothetical protein
MPSKQHVASVREIREALSALKQSGRYDDIADEVLLRHLVRAILV